MTLEEQTQIARRAIVQELFMQEVVEPMLASVRKCIEECRKEGSVEPEAAVLLGVAEKFLEHVASFKP